jgi:hypothetical protein
MSLDKVLREKSVLSYSGRKTLRISYGAKENNGFVKTRENHDDEIDIDASDPSAQHGDHNDRGCGTFFLQRRQSDGAATAAG